MARFCRGLQLFHGMTSLQDEFVSSALMSEAKFEAEKKNYRILGADGMPVLAEK